MTRLPVFPWLRIATASIALTSAGVLSAAQRPNILFLMTDQQCASTLSAAGNPHLKTPAMDGLGARGVRFEKAYCTFPLCTPDRASLDTSRMPHELGIFDNGKGIPADVPTMGELFKKAGYQTAWAGKWHVPTPYPGFNDNRRKGAPRGFDVLPLEGPKHRSNPDVGPGLGSDPAAVKAALKFLRQPHDRLFLLTVSLLNPHDICEYPRKPEKYTKPRSGDVLPPLPDNFDPTAEEAPSLQAARARRMASNSGVGGYQARDWQKYRWAYYRLTETVDSHIATVLGALEEADLKDNTLIIFTADHGEMCGAHRLATKQQMYEEAVNVPLIVCAPGRTQPPVVNRTHLVSALDVLPTMCDYAGVSAVPSFRGRSLRPLIEEKSTAWRDHLVVEMGAEVLTRMVRSDRYKYIIDTTGGNSEMLFDLHTDPGEMQNLVGNAHVATVLKSHRNLLKAWVAETNDRFVFPPGL